MGARQIGERIGQLRRDLNLSKAEFGKMIGVTERYVRNIEKGNHAITWVVIANICDKTGVSADYIIYGTYDPLTAIAELNGFTHEQAQLVFDMVMSAVKFLNTPTGNNALVQEVLRQYKPPAVCCDTPILPKI